MNLDNALALARQAAKEADELMMSYYQQDYAVYKKAGARSHAEAVLTEPDLKCDRLLRKLLQEHFPNCGVVTEESVDELAEGWHTPEWIWYVDPIDGSKSYLEGTDCFGVSIALCRRGVPMLGVISNPAEGWVAWAADGRGAWFNDEPIQLNNAVGRPPLPIISTGQNKSRSYLLALSFLRPEEVVLRSSVVTKSLLVLQGKADYYFSLPREVFRGGAPSVWDLAGAAAIFREAGGMATDCYGRPLRFNTGEYRWETGHIFAAAAARDAIVPPLELTINRRKEQEQW